MYTIHQNNYDVYELYAVKPVLVVTCIGDHLLCPHGSHTIIIPHMATYVIQVSLYLRVHIMYIQSCIYVVSSKA